MRLSVVIPVLNNWPLTRDCLKRLRETTAPGGLEVLLVDNGSSDETPRESPELGRALFGESFRYLPLGANRNFGPACNRGAAEGRGEFLFFLNNDTLPEPGWLEPLLDAFQKDPRLGAAGPLLVYPDSGRVQHLGVCFDPLLRTDHLYQHFPADHPLALKKRTLQAITAAAMLIPRELFLSLGGFHEDYANGYEDLDLCFALREKGYSPACVPESRIGHLESRTPDRFAGESANSALFSERRGGSVAPDLHVIARRDGYDLTVNAMLEMHPEVSRERKEELAARAEKLHGPAELLALLDEEPLWPEGWEALAQDLESRSLWDEALHARHLQTSFCPSVGRFRSLMLAAARAGRSGIADAAARRLTAAQALLADPERRKELFRDAAARLRANGLDELLPLYREALDRPVRHA